MTLVQITNYTSPCTDCPQVNIHCIEHFFTVHDFWATCACPEKKELPWNFSLTVLNILFTFRIFNNLRLPWKQFPLKFFTVLNILFTIQDFWATLCLPWNFSLYWIYFLHSGVLSNLHVLALKNRVALNSHYWLYIFYHSGFLSNLRLLWKTELPWYFHCIKHVFFIIQEFWVIHGFPEKTELPWSFLLFGIYFLHSEFLSSLHLLWTTEGSLNLPYWIYIFYYSGVLSNLRFPWKAKLPRNFLLCGIYFLHSDFLSSLCLP